LIEGHGLQPHDAGEEEEEEKEEEKEEVKANALSQVNAV
jgi:hypothetical protein